MRGQGQPWRRFDGRLLSLLWMVPFAGILLSIAVMLLAVPQFWHHHSGKVAAAWALMVIVPFAVIHGVPTAAYEVIDLMFLNYIPFIVLLLALFTVTGGIHIKGNLHGSPSMNTALLAIGTVLAGWLLGWPATTRRCNRSRQTYQSMLLPSQPEP